MHIVVFSCTLQCVSPAVIKLKLLANTCPLVLEEWKDALSSHTDQAFAQYICNGIQYGLCIGYNVIAPPSCGTSKHDIGTPALTNHRGVPGGRETTWTGARSIHSLAPTMKVE